MDKLIIIPTYNERENITPLLRGIFSEVPDTDVLFVDDGSPDGTVPVIESMQETDSRIHLMQRDRKEGLGRAYIAGFEWMRSRGYQRICTMDADLSHQPRDLPTLFGALDRVDVAVGSRYVGGIRVMNWPLYRLFLSKGAATYARLITGMPVRDPTSGFTAFRRPVLDNIALHELEASGYCFQIETKFTAWRMGFVIEEIPITFIDRVAGESKMSGAIVREAMRIVAKMVLRKGRRRPPAIPHPASVCHQKKDALPGNN